MAKKSKLQLVDTQTRLLPFPLKPKDIEQRSTALLALLDEKDMVKNKKAEDAAAAKAIAAGHDAKLEQIDKDVNVLRRQIAAASETRETNVEIYRNAEDRVIEVHRTDLPLGHPDRVVSTVPMNLNDLAEAEAANAEADAKLTDEERALRDAEAAADADAASKTAEKAAKSTKVKPDAKAEGKGSGKAKSTVVAKSGKKGNGKAKVIGADLDGAEEMAPLGGKVLPMGKKFGSDEALSDV